MRTLLFLVALVAAPTLFAQRLGELKLATQSYGLNKFKKADQRIYIGNFTVHYQTHFSLRDSKAGSTKRGSSQVVSNVAIGGLTEKELLQTTNDIFLHFRRTLTDAGYTFIDAEEAGKIDLFQDWERVEGGRLFQAKNLYGYTSVVPEGFAYYVRRDNGKVKRKIVSPDSKITKQLDDAIVANVHVYVSFAEDGETGWSRSLKRAADFSKVVIKTNLRIGDPSMSAQGGLGEQMGLGPRVADLPRGLSLAGGGAVGLGTQAAHVVTFKKPLQIEEVMAEEKIKEFAQGESGAGYYFSSGVYFLSSEEVTATRSIAYDKAAYLRGVTEAGKAFINAGLAAFLAKAGK